MEACGMSEGERRCYEEECVRVGCAIPTLTSHAGERGWAHLSAGWRLPLGVIALVIVEKVRKGKVKYRPVSDYSRPVDVGVNARIELEHDEFTTVKEAYGMMRPGYGMVKVDMEAAYRSVGIANMFWPHQCFELDGVKMDGCTSAIRESRAPGDLHERAEEAMMLVVEFVTFLGFKVNSAKCEGPSQVLEFLGVLLDTSGEVCTTSIDKERIAVVVKQAGALKA
ncbi:hypothetical protein CYMTET_46760 [Cymbomonas tetramitiformis]|uniref:Uncharacterized protein n=1 Tax=Cymbomonas tetramitiformis TaxID=36881 RepID=A0AAE0BXH3_9CHLO|nr:hypothetical protein CYMTET_46760 [Cymbomonas tetramitiformis]